MYISSNVWQNNDKLQVHLTVIKLLLKHVSLSASAIIFIYYFKNVALKRAFLTSESVVFCLHCSTA